MQVVAAAIINQSNKILIARRAPHKKLAGYWEFPGGKVETGETPELALVREIFEEFGIDIDIESFYMDCYYKYQDGEILLKSYCCQFRAGNISLTDHDLIALVDKNELDQFDFAPADLPIVDKLMGR